MYTNEILIDLIILKIEFLLNTCFGIVRELNHNIKGFKLE